MATIGLATRPAEPADVLVRGRQRAALIPDLLVEARRVANTVIAGWHGRRRRGIGENFWQFRPYVDGESLARIDWRRSGRDDHLYVRDKEWEAAHTIWLWADRSPSMLFRSRQAPISKEARALVLVFALAELLSRSGERIGWPGIGDPLTARNGAERLAAKLTEAGAPPARPDLAPLGRGSDAVLIGDFLEPPQETKAWLSPLASRGVRVHLVEVADPAEEAFPYSGRTEFHDPETGTRLTAGRAETVAEDYRAAYLARRAEMADWCGRLGWTHTVHHTSHPASEALVRLHLLMSADAGETWR